MDSEERKLHGSKLLVHRFGFKNKSQSRMVLAFSVAIMMLLYISSGPSSAQLPTEGAYHPETYNSYNSVIKYMSSVLDAETTQQANIIADGRLQCTRKLTDTYYINDTTIDIDSWSEMITVNELATGDEYAAKFPTGTSDQNIKSTIMSRLTQNIPGVMRLHDVVCHDDKVTPIYAICKGTVLHHFSGYGYCTDLSTKDVRIILKKVYHTILSFMTLGIRHREINERNIFFDKKTKRVCVADSILSKEYPIAVTLGYENSTLIERQLMAEYKASGDYSTLSDDVFAFAALFAHLLNIPSANQTLTSLPDLLAVLGRDEFMAYLDRHGLELPADMVHAVDSAPAGRVDWMRYRNECNKHIMTDDTMAMLDGLFQFTYANRVQFFLQADRHRFWSGKLDLI